jgi:osmotically-inducible protein OsmY
MQLSKSIRIRTYALVLCLTLSGAGMAAIEDKEIQNKSELKTKREPSQAELQLAKLVREELEMLPNYSVFDYLFFQVDGRAVELLGQVSRSVLKSDAEGAIKKLEGVEEVINHVEVLPISPIDVSIRRSVYRAIYQHPTLSRYAMQAVPPIHIIVKDGKVFLEGVLANESDKNIADIQAHSVSEVSSVANNLHIEKSN